LIDIKHVNYQSRLAQALDTSVDFLMIGVDSVTLRFVVIIVMQNSDIVTKFTFQPICKCCFSRTGSTSYTDNDTLFVIHFFLLIIPLKDAITFELFSFHIANGLILATYQRVESFHFTTGDNLPPQGFKS